MNRVLRLLAASLITILLSLTGYVAVTMAMSTATGHSDMAEHGYVDCVSFCLSKTDANFVLPVITITGQLLPVFTSVLVLFILPALLALIFAIYAARPRPSPNLVKLYAHYLD